MVFGGILNLRQTEWRNRESTTISIYNRLYPKFPKSPTMKSLTNIKIRSQICLEYIFLKFHLERNQSGVGVEDTRFSFLLEESVSYGG